MLLLGLLAAFPARSAETDQFTGRFDALGSLVDREREFDEWVSAKLRQAAGEMRGEMSHDERIETVARIIIGQWFTDLFSEAEVWLRKNRGGQHAFEASSKGVFRGTSVTDARIGFFYGLAPTIRLAGVLIGEDKIGHFFSQGLQYYRLYLEYAGKSESEKHALLLRYGHEQEIGYLGLATDGVYSRSDLAANWAGFRFWEALFDGRDPYLRYSMKARRWEAAREFRAREYVTDDWDETLNPPFTVSERMASQIQSNVANLCGQEPYRSARLGGTGRRAREEYSAGLPVPGHPLVFDCRVIQANAGGGSG